MQTEWNWVKLRYRADEGLEESTRALPKPWTRLVVWSGDGMTMNYPARPSLAAAV